MLTATALLLCGCANDVRWRGFVFDPVFKESQRDNKLTFVYLRNWYLPECAAFENDVLRTPAIAEATREFYAVMLEFDLARELAAEWSIEKPPAIVILDPGRRLLVRRVGPMTIEELLAAIDEARLAGGVSAP